MAAEGEDPDGAAERLEAALERIARAAERAGSAETLSAQVAPRLDRLIAQLRMALGEPD